MNRLAPLALATAAILGGSGCAGPQAQALIQPHGAHDAASLLTPGPGAARTADGPSSDGAALPSALPRRAIVAGVPFYPQRDYECGPASLASVLAAAGRPVDVDTLVAQTYLPARAGSLQVELQAAVRRAGLLAYPPPPRLGALLATVADGRPVLVLQNLSLAWAPVWHYAVLIGYDLDREAVILHSGVTESTTMSIHAFEHTWVRAGSWSLVAMDPRQAPPTAQPLGWLRAAAALERTAPAAAREAYATALARWPGFAPGWFAAGTAALADGELDRAEQRLRRAVTLDPGYADAWNNLAVTLGRLARPVEGLAAVERALSLKPDRRSDYEATRAALQADPQRR